MALRKYDVIAIGYLRFTVATGTSTEKSFVCKNVPIIVI